MANKFKVEKVMSEFKDGKLKSSGSVVKNKKQAVAIALSEQKEADKMTDRTYQDMLKPHTKKKKKKKKVSSTQDLRDIYQEKYGKKSY